MSEWKTTKLSDLLNNKQILEVRDYLNKKDATTQGLAKLLKKYDEQLRKKGVLPEYLAYNLWYQLKERKVKEVV